MYYAEMLIKGVLHYKTTPNGKWKPVSVEELSRRLMEAERALLNQKQDKRK